MKKFTVKNYSHLQNIGQISNEAMQMHFKLYEGYVNNLNIMLDKFEMMQTFDSEYFGKFTPEWNELHRRFGWEWNGVRNHELFFESLKATPNLNTSEEKGTEEKIQVLSEKINNVFKENFGSFENWKKDFLQMCKIRGMGWVMLVQDNKTGELINTFVNEHDAGMLADVKVILLIDMFEHAYVKDFGANRIPYIESIFSHIDWEIIEKRLN
jgi:superoxide dismutase, Fe-Mn family